MEAVKGFQQLIYPKNLLFCWRKTFPRFAFASLPLRTVFSGSCWRRRRSWRRAAGPGRSPPTPPSTPHSATMLSGGTKSGWKEWREQFADCKSGLKRGVLDRVRGGVRGQAGSKVGTSSAFGNQLKYNVGKSVNILFVAKLSWLQWCNKFCSFHVCWHCQRHPAWYWCLPKVWRGMPRRGGQWASALVQTWRLQSGKLSPK